MAKISEAGLCPSDPPPYVRLRSPVLTVRLCCSMGHDNSGALGGAWFLERVEIELPLLHRKWTFPHSRWIAKDDGDGKLEHDLYPDTVDSTLPDDRSHNLTCS